MTITQQKNVIKAIFILSIISGSIIGLSFYFYYNPLFFEQRTPQKFFWLSALFTEESIDVLQENHEIIDMLSPTWYTLQSDGSLKNTAIEDYGLDKFQYTLDNCSFYNIPLHPLVSGGSESNMRNLLENPSNQQNFFDSVNTEIVNYELAGINIDLEGIPSDLRDEFNSFITLLRNNMDPTKNLSIDVPAKEKEDISGWAGWCDYEHLGSVVDKVMIMTYDLHGGWSGPGEVASTSWVQRVLAYSVQTIPIEKIFIGIPFYGYDWSEDPNWDNWGFSYSFFENQFALYGGTRTRTTDGHEIRYSYTDGNGFDHVAYYCDVTTTFRKEQFLSRYPVGGYCYWHLSCGDPAYFEDT